MKKIYRYLLMTVLALCLSIPAFGAEAATIALLPLINNVQGDQIAGQQFYSGAISAINAQTGYMLVENDKVTAAIDNAKVGQTVPSKNELMKISKDGNVDIVIAVQLDKLDYETIYSSEENQLKLQLEGNAVAYNRITGEYYQHKLYDDTTVPEAITARWDWTHEQWGRAVKREINRILKVKKVKLDTPRMSKL